MNHEKYVALAIKEAEKAVKKGDSPFGAVIVKDDKVITSAHSRVAQDFDLAAHAELSVIRKACAKLKTFDLSDCTLYSSGEPCLMCVGAISWVKISKVYFSTYNADARAIGFSEPEAIPAIE
ncbi:nucleoside deaminase, partial [Nanoarchaeota archaeon]